MVYNITELFQMEVAGNMFTDYVIAIIVFIVALILMRFFRRYIIKRLKSIAKSSKTNIDNYIFNAIDDIGWPAYLLVALLVSLNFITVPLLVNNLIYLVTVVVVTFYLTKGIGYFIRFAGKRMVSKDEEKEEVDTTIIDLLRKIVIALVWLLALLFILAGFGVDVTGAVVGLGAGGIVIGFALQNVMSDLFASFSIYFDKPFRKGDFIIIGNDMGTVEKIGIQSTRIRTLQGQQLIVSNKELTNTRVNNYKRMKRRRIVFSFGVTYETPSKKLEKIPAIVKDIIDKTEHAEIDRVHFKSFADFSLVFEVVYYVDVPDYNTYMDVQQKINFELKRRLEKENIEFAFPTQTVYINKMK